MTSRNIGIWGTGRHTRQHRAPGLLALRDEGVRIRGLGDIDVGAAAQLAADLSDAGYIEKVRRTGYPVQPPPESERPAVWGSLDEMLDDPTLDGVVVVTPHRFHGTDAIQVMRRGKHCLVEKPMAETPEQAEEMVDVSEAEGVVLAVGYQLALAPQAALAASTGRAAIGPITGGESRWTRENGSPPDEHFWNDLQTTGVGRDFIPHELAKWIAAEGANSLVEVVEATGSRKNGVARYGVRFKGFDTVDAKLRLRTGGLFVIFTSWETGTPPDDAAGITFHGDPGARLEAPMPVHKYDGYVPDLEALKAVTRTNQHGTQTGPAPMSFVQLIVAQNRNWVNAGAGTEELMFTAPQALAVEGWVDRIQAKAIQWFLEHNPDALDE